MRSTTFDRARGGGWRPPKLTRQVIISPGGKDVLRKVNGTYNRPLYAAEPLEQITTY